VLRADRNEVDVFTDERVHLADLVATERVEVRGAGLAEERKRCIHAPLTESLLRVARSIAQAR